MVTIIILKNKKTFFFKMHYYTCSFGPTRMYMLKKRVDIVRPTRKMIENPVKYVHEWEDHEEIKSRLL